MSQLYTPPNHHHPPFLPHFQTTTITSAALHSNTLPPPVDGALIRETIMGWL